LPSLEHRFHVSIARSRATRLAILLAGLLASQLMLYGPSLIGSKILLPIDLLAQSDVYIPVTPETANLIPHDSIQSDLPYVIEPERMFVASELQAGRWPWWVPGQYAGKPVLQWPWLSPLSILLSVIRSPVVLAWYQLFAALIAGLGFYVFCRRALGVGFWSAAIAAWSYPLTGFFVFWLGYPTSAPVYWLPWVMLAVDGVIRKPSWGRLASLGIATCILLCSRQLDISAQVLIASGLYGVWRLVNIYGAQCLAGPARKAGLFVLAGWLLGGALAAPYVMPISDYVRTGARTAERAAGFEEREPGGLSALPLLAIPDINGGTRKDSYPLPGPFQIESLAAGYAGVVALLFLVPLAWRNHRRRSTALFLSGLALLGFAWCLGVGGIVMILRLPGLNMLSHNRMVFVSSFAILAMAALGLESLSEPNDGGDRRWPYLAAGLAGAMSLWLLYRVGHLPEPVATEIQKLFAEGKAARWIHDAAGVGRVQAHFARVYLVGGLLSLAVCVCWLILARLRTWRSWSTALLTGLMFLDMVWFAHDRTPQPDPAWYYPRVPLLDRIAKSSSGRIIAFQCLPATLAQVAGLRDVRGYDGVDPRRYVQLLLLAGEPRENDFVYGRTEWLKPKVSYPTLESVKFSPILDLLGVEYMIIRGAVQGAFKPAFVEPDYWALRNPSALPRVFVPARVESVPDEKERLSKLAAPDFDPKAVAYVETAAAVPEGARGRATIIAETPSEVNLSLSMETPGLVVLTDTWDQGWRARLNGEPVPILIADHALRGVVVPQGSWILKFDYQPASLPMGLVLFGLGMVALAGLLMVERRSRRQGGQTEKVAGSAMAAEI
jgi:hypothetical protein